MIEIFSLIGVNVCFFNTGYSRAPPDPPRPCGRAKSHPYSSPRDSRRKTDVATKVGEGRFFKVALPETVSNLYFFFNLGSTVERSIQDRQSFS